MFSSTPLPIVLVVFGGAAVLAWLAGGRLSIAVDVLSDRYHLGQELGGQIFLGIVDNLPELAIVVAASVSGQIALATGNLLGGIAMQTVVLVLLDAVAVHDRPISFAGAALTLVLQATFLIALLAITLMGMALRVPVFLRITPVGILLVAGWVFGLWMMRRAERGLPWTDHGVPRDLLEKSVEDVSQKQEMRRSTEAAGPISSTWLMFLVASALTLLAGVALEQTSERLAQVSHLGGAVFGATVLAAVTALPEVSSGIEAIRLGDYQLAFSDVFGSNAFLPVCLPFITLISGRDPLAVAGPTNLYLSALGIVLTVVYVGGLIFRPQRQFLRLGPDSWSVLVLYVLAIAGLVFVR